MLEGKSILNTRNAISYGERTTLKQRSTYHPDARAERVWGQVRTELGFYDTGVAVGAGDTAGRSNPRSKRVFERRNKVDVPPNDTDFRALDLPLCPVDVGDPLRENPLDTISPFAECNCVPCPGRTARPPSSRHPRSEGGRCWGGCCA